MNKKEPKNKFVNVYKDHCKEYYLTKKNKMFCIWVVSWKDWKNTITIPIFDQRSSIVYAIHLMPNLIFNLEWTLGICVGPSPITSFWVLALVRYISTFGNLGIWWDFKNVGSSPIYTSVGPRTDPPFVLCTGSTIRHIRTESNLYAD